jgi:hypothetical protein
VIDFLDMALAFAILHPPLTHFGNKQLASRVVPKLLSSRILGKFDIISTLAFFRLERIDSTRSTKIFRFCAIIQMERPNNYSASMFNLSQNSALGCLLHVLSSH